MSEHSTSWLKQPPVVCPVTLVLKTVIYKSKLLGFQHCESPAYRQGRLALEHSEPNTDFMDGY